MKKIKININRPKPDSEQISSHMSFDDVMKGYREHRKDSWFKRPFMLFFAALLVIVSAVFVLRKDKGDNTGMQAAVIPAVTVADTSPESVIKPLIPGMQINETNFRCSAEKGDTLLTPSGAQIIVPAKAFLDEKGRTVKDTVTIRFREFYDPLDFACSGIPMTYDSAGRTWIFESSGMCEIQGFLNGKPVHINMAKPLSITMPTKFGKNDPNLYRMDSTTGVWTYIGKPTISGDRQVKKENIVKGDTMEMDDLSYKAADSSPSITAPSIKKIDAQIRSLENQKAALKEPRVPRKLRKDKHSFTIDVKADEFPELGPYKEVVFEVENKDFSEEYYKYEWNNTELIEIEPGTKYKLVLEREYKPGAGAKESVQNDASVPFRLELIVSPRLNPAEFAKAMETYTAKFNEYKALKLEKERQIAELKRKREEELQARIKAQEELARKAREAWAKEQGELGYWNIRVSFEADRFGIYNSDRPVTYKHPARVVANFSAEGESLDVDKVYVLQLKQNSLMAWYFDGCCNNPMNYDPASANVLFTVLKDKRIAWLGKEEFKKLPLSGKADITLAVSDKPFEKIADMKKYIGL